MVICLETATNLCSVALCNSAGVVALKESSEQKSHATQLTVLIDHILRENSLKASDLEAVSVSKGPGSYTGLRIGVSVAKGIAYAASLPLIGIETTESMFWGIREFLSSSGSIKENTIFCPMLDARRMEVYYSLYDSTGNKIRPVTAEIIKEDSFIDIADDRLIVFFGTGASKCRDIIKRQNIIIIDDFFVSAAYMQKPAYKSLRDQNFEDIAYFEPFYLKEFITTLTKKDIIGNTRHLT